MNELMILSAKYLFIVPVLLTVIYILLEFIKNKKEIIFFAVFNLPLSLIIAKIAGHFFYDTRPFVRGHFVPLISHAPDNGFPSDHALLSFALASLVFAYSKPLGLILFAIGLIVGFSRVYVGVHSPLDIAGSFVISVLIACLVYLFLKTKRGQAFFVKFNSLSLQKKTS